MIFHGDDNNGDSKQKGRGIVSSSGNNEASKIFTVPATSTSTINDGINAAKAKTQSRHRQTNEIEGAERSRSKKGAELVENRRRSVPVFASMKLIAKSCAPVTFVGTSSSWIFFRL